MANNKQKKTCPTGQHYSVKVDACVKDTKKKHERKPSPASDRYGDWLEKHEGRKARASRRKIGKGFVKKDSAGAKRKKAALRAESDYIQNLQRQLMKK